MVAGTTTDPRLRSARNRTKAHSTARVRGQSGPDRVSVALFSLAAFLAILALLASQLSGGVGHVRPAPAILRKVYRTTVVERVLPAGTGGRGGASVTQSESGSVSGALPAAPIATRTS
jgi:hypothetical protein